MLRTIGIIVASLVVVGLLCGGALAALLHTDAGHRRIAALVISQVNARISGRLELDELERIDLPKLTLRGVRLIDPEGVTAIEVERAELTLDMAALRAGRLAFHRASIEGGLVRVTEDAQGENNMERLFRGRGGAAPSHAASILGLVDLRDLWTSGLALELSGGSLPSLRIEQIHGVMRVRVGPDGEPELRFDSYRGVVVSGLPTGRLEFHAVTGWVQPAIEPFIRFAGAGASEGEPVEFELQIFTKPKLRVKIDGTFARVSTESLATRALAAWTSLSGSLELAVHQAP